MSKDFIPPDSDLLAYIPQRPPFVMIDTLIDIRDNEVKSAFTVTRDNVLVADGHLQASGLVENMAQTCALFSGYRANEVGEKAPVGFIGAIKGLMIHQLPKIGDRIQTIVEMGEEVMGIQLAQAKVEDREGEALAEGEFRIFIKPEEDNATNR